MSEETKPNNEATNAGSVRVHAWVRPLTRASEDTLAERQRQIEVEGWTCEHDDDHDMGEMANAAAAYAVASSHPDTYSPELPPWFWPWPDAAWKPSGPREMLVKAGALILAEIERLDRRAKRGPDDESAG